MSPSRYAAVADCKRLRNPRRERSYVEIVEDDEGHRHRLTTKGKYPAGLGRIVFAETIEL